MTKRTKLTDRQISKLADDTFERILTDEKDGNARVIAARRGNTAPKFKANDMKKRANSASAHVKGAQRALKRNAPPTLERFKT